MPFSEIIGHKKAIERLQRLMKEGRIPHALLFTGPEGIGKKLTALGLAKALLCEKKNDDYCNACITCRHILQGNHPDVSVIEPEGNSIKIDQLRDWQKGLEAKPYMGSWRVTIIDQAEKMTTGAANSILKVIEEPPDDTIICLTALEPRDILPTIVSRCQILRFTPLERSLFITILMEKAGLTKAQAGLVYYVSKGQLARGLEMNLESLYALREKWIGVLNSDIVMKKGEKKTDQASLNEGLDLVAHWCRDIMLMQLGIGGELLTNQDMKDQLEMEANQTPHVLIQHRMDLVLKTIEDLKANANPNLALDCITQQWNY